MGISNSTTEWVPLEDPKPPQVMRSPATLLLYPDQDGDEEVAPTPAAPPFSLHHPVQVEHSTMYTQYIRQSRTPVGFLWAKPS